MAAACTRSLIDPDTFATGVPYPLLARLRRESPVVWVDEPPLHGWPGGAGFWLVLRHADVVAVLRDPARFSSWLGATQVRDPATPEALAYVRRMMLNQDPPEHGRLRRLLARSFTPPRRARPGGADPDQRRRAGAPHPGRRRLRGVRLRWRR